MFKLQSLNLVTTSKINCFNEACGICKEDNNSYCINCASSGNTNCNVVIGECGHAYHEHCLNEWFKTRRVCPLDNKVWQVKIKK
jgi:RING-box protein 1